MSCTAVERDEAAAAAGEDATVYGAEAGVNCSESTCMGLFQQLDSNIFICTRHGGLHICSALSCECASHRLHAEKYTCWVSKRLLHVKPVTNDTMSFGDCTRLRELVFVDSDGREDITTVQVPANLPIGATSVSNPSELIVATSFLHEIAPPEWRHDGKAGVNVTPASFIHEFNCAVQTSDAEATRILRAELAGEDEAECSRLRCSDLPVRPLLV